jgi:neutral ceramidase
LLYSLTYYDWRFIMKKCMLKFLLSVIFSLVLLFSSDNVAAFSEPKGHIFAGTAKVMITPKVPIPMSGYGGRKDPFKGVHDDIFARVIVFSDGENKAILIAAEVIGFSNSFWEEFTELLTKETGIQKEYVMLSAVHNHNGPVTGVHKEEPSPDVLSYVKELEEKLVTATKEAMNNLVPVSIGAGKGECKMNINRRAPNGNGEISLGQNPYAPCDHEVGVIRIDDMSGDPLSIVMNWPCHGVVLGPKNYLITGDWPGAASRYVEEKFGTKFIAPVTIGASGDINPLYGPHIDFENNSSYAYGKDAIGEDLGSESMSVAKDIKTFSKGKITALQRVISLPGKQRDDGTTQQPASKGADSLRVRLSAVKIGNIVLTGVSGEVFNQISVQMRNQSPYLFTFMITHCNGSSGYLVTEDAYPVEGVGAYEVKSKPKGGYEINSTRAKTGAEKAIIDNLLKMIAEL